MTGDTVSNTCGGATGSNSALSVLIVDDSAVMRNFIKRVLSLSGLAIEETFEAPDGSAALDMLNTTNIDLVLCDINMPVMNGEELLRLMEADDDLRQIPLIVVSTDSSTHRVEMMLAYGARGYVQKPFQPEVLRSEVERVLGEGIV
jgi:two-component system chemotaxis response regulator CheY